MIDLLQELFDLDDIVIFIKYILFRIVGNIFGDIFTKKIKVIISKIRRVFSNKKVKNHSNANKSGLKN